MATRGLLQRGVPATLPPWLRFVKIAILVLALIILALAAYAISVVNNYYNGYGGYGGYYYSNGGVGGLLIFVAIKTFIIIGATLAVEIFAPHLFYRVVILIAYIISIIFWLSAWAWSADLAAAWLSDLNLCNEYGDGYCDGSIFKSEGSALAACAALGAVAWILSIVNLVFYIRACLADPDGTGVVPQQQAELGQVKAQEAAPVAYAPQGYQQPYEQQPQQPYQQPYQHPQQPYATQ